MLYDDSADLDRGRARGREGWLRRGTKCPTEQVLAGFLDGGLDEVQEARTREHISKCPFCRHLAADIAEMRAADAPPLPPGLLSRAISAAPTHREWRFVFAPVAAVAVMVVAASFTFLLRTPQQELPKVASTPSAPVTVAKAEPPTRVSKGPISAVVRKSFSVQVSPDVTFPGQGALLTAEQVQFRWKPLHQARYYEVRLVTSEGGPVWKGLSEKPGLQPPHDVTIHEGNYFVWVTAFTEDGRESRSAVVPFKVVSRR